MGKYIVTEMYISDDNIGTFRIDHASTTTDRPP